MDPEWRNLNSFEREKKLRRLFDGNSPVILGRDDDELLDLIVSADGVLEMLPKDDLFYGLCVQGPAVTDRGLASFFRGDRHNLESVVLYADSLSNKALSYLPPINNLTSFTYVKPFISSDEVVYCSRYCGLKQLLLRKLKANPEMLVSLGKLLNLEDLNLGIHDRVFDLNGLSSCPKLTRLRLDAPALDDRCFEDLSTCQSIRDLGLMALNFTETNIAHIASLPHLEDLRIDTVILRDDCTADENTRFPTPRDFDFVPLAFNHKLRNLWIVCNSVNGSVLEALGRSKSITYLYIESNAFEVATVSNLVGSSINELVLRTCCQLSDPLISRFAELQQIRSLNIGCPNAAVFEQKLCRALPNSRICAIDWPAT